MSEALGHEPAQDSVGARTIRAIHNRAIFSRRVKVLASEISKLIPPNYKVLDVGSGSGNIAAAIQAQRPDVRIEGVDVLVRDETLIPVQGYDGQTLPFPDDSFDCAMLVDVLHHTDDPAEVLREVGRVAPMIIIKDHFRNGLFAASRLRMMDWVGNAPHGVRLPYNYLSRGQWDETWRRTGLIAGQVLEDIPLYPPPLSWVFGLGLHFIASLQRSRDPASN